LAPLTEVGYGLHLAKRIGYLTIADFKKIEEQTRMAAGPLVG
jgi:hypothetical protein